MDSFFYNFGVKYGEKSLKCLDPEETDCYRQSTTAAVIDNGAQAVKVAAAVATGPLGAAALVGEVAVGAAVNVATNAIIDEVVTLVPEIMVCLRRKNGIVMVLLPII